MSEKYKQFLQLNNIITEKDFDKLLEEFPATIDLTKADWDCFDSNNIDAIAERLIQAYLNQETIVAWCDNVNYENKSFELYDVESLEELEAIKNSFSNWNIYNYTTLEQSLKEKRDSSRFDELINYIRSNVSLEQLEKFVNSLNEA